MTQLLQSGLTERVRFELTSDVTTTHDVAGRSLGQFAYRSKRTALFIHVGVFVIPNVWLAHRMLTNLVPCSETESPGFEPGLLVLETRVLPLDDAPKSASFISE